MPPHVERPFSGVPALTQPKTVGELSGRSADTAADTRYPY